MGGGDEDTNRARLTYREHFLVHWLLTKICTGGDLRRMQRALFAMTLKHSGERVTTGWQFETAKRAIRDLELDPVAEARWRKNFRQRQAVERIEKNKRRMARVMQRKQERENNRQIVESSAALKSARDITGLNKLTGLLLRHGPKTANIPPENRLISQPRLKKRKRGGLETYVEVSKRKQTAKDRSKRPEWLKPDKKVHVQNAHRAKGLKSLPRKCRTVVFNDVSS